MSNERRAYPRYTTSTLASCSMGATKFDGRFVDIGPSGGMLETSALIPVGKKVTVRILGGSSSNQPIQIIARVVRLLRTEQSKPALGLQWARVTSRCDMETVVNYLSDELRIPPNDAILTLTDTDNGVVGVFQHELPAAVESPASVPPKPAEASPPSMIMVAPQRGLPVLVTIGSSRCRLLLVGAGGGRLYVLADIRPVHKTAQVVVRLLPDSEELTAYMSRVGRGLGDYMATLELAAAGQAAADIINTWAHRLGQPAA